MHTWFDAHLDQNSVTVSNMYVDRNKTILKNATI